MTLAEIIIWLRISGYSMALSPEELQILNYILLSFVFILLRFGKNYTDSNTELMELASKVSLFMSVLPREN